MLGFGQCVVRGGFPVRRRSPSSRRAKVTARRGSEVSEQEREQHRHRYPPEFIEIAESIIVGVQFDRHPQVAGVGSAAAAAEAQQPPQTDTIL